jgi:aspartate/methionine/tyrosine aminotransferase
MNVLLDLIQSPPAVAIADLVREKERGGQKIAKLQTGEPSFPTPGYIKEALQTALLENKTTYCASQGILELRNALSGWYNDDFDVHVSPEEILISVGAVGAIYCAMNALLNKNDEVLIVDPCWPQYVNIVQMLGASPCRIPTEKTNGRLTPDLLRKYITRNCKLLIINNPANPSGVVYSESEINEFIRISKEYQIYILFDEVYNRLVFSNTFSSVLTCSEYLKYKDRIVYINSFSKTFSMTGWRIGYAFMPLPVLEKTLRVSQNIFTNVTTFCQYAAAKALTEKKAHADEYIGMLNFYKKRYAELVAILEEKKIKYLKPEGAFYFFIKINTESVAFSKMLLQEHEIAVVPGTSYGEEYSDYIRISFAVDEYSYATFIKWLKDHFNS